MDYAVYKLIHFAGMFSVIFAFGVMAAGQKGKKVAILHGVGLFLVLFGGFGMLAKLGIHWPWDGWIFAKVAIWLALGALIAPVRRSKLPAGAARAVVLGLAVLAAALALWKPF